MKPQLIIYLCFNKLYAMKNFMFLVFFAVQSSLFCQTFDWANTVNPNYSYTERSTSVHKDMDGNVYLTGYTNGAPESAKLLIAKYTQNGELLWSKESSCTGKSIANCIKSDQNNDIFVTGTFNGNLTIDAFTLISHGGSGEVFILKLNSSGIVQWVKSFGNTGYNYGKTIAVDSLSNIYVSGIFEMSVLVGTKLLHSYGQSDVFLAKYTPDGQFVWAKQFGGEKYDIVKSIKVIHNNIYMTGDFYRTALFDTITLTNIDGKDMFVAKLDLDGQVKWAKNSSGADDFLDYAGGEDVSVDSKENVYIVGVFAGNVSFGSCTLSTLWAGENFVIKYDSSGSCTMAQKLHGTTNNGIETDKFDNTFITGTIYLSCTFDTITLQSYGYFDAFVVKYNSNFHAVWAVNCGGTSGDYANDIELDNDNNVFLAGDYGGISGHAVFGMHTLNCNNTTNIFLTKIEDLFTNTENSGTVSLLDYYPNPTKGLVNFNNTGVRDVKIYNSWGVLIKSIDKQSYFNSVDISDLRNGIYFFVVETAGHRFYTMKIIKEQ